MKPQNHLVGKAARLEEEIKVQQAAIRQMDPKEFALLPTAQLRLERLESLLKALQQSFRRRD